MGRGVPLSEDTSAAVHTKTRCGVHTALTGPHVLGASRLSITCEVSCILHLHSNFIAAACLSLAALLLHGAIKTRQPLRTPTTRDSRTSSNPCYTLFQSTALADESEWSLRLSTRSNMATKRCYRHDKGQPRSTPTVQKRAKPRVRASEVLIIFIDDLIPQALEGYH